MTVTRWKATSGKPGSRMTVDFQLGSKSPIVSAVAKLNGVTVSQTIKGSNLSDVGSVWFYAPPIGSYVLSVEAANSFGCKGVGVSLVPLTIK